MNDWALPIINQDTCILCGNCAATCPEHVLELIEANVVFVQPQACTYCTQCESICPVNAISCRFNISWDDESNKQ